MLGFEEARQRVILAGSPLETETVPLASASERVLREDLVNPRPLPAFDHSAMDGFAIATSSLRGAPPYELEVVAEARAGGDSPALQPGTAVRIFTGAELPDGADAVVIQEDTALIGSKVRIDVAVRSFDNVRRRGEDLPAGALALPRGSRLGPFQLGLIAALDRAAVVVSRRARVVLVTTGDELRPPGAADERGKIPDSNSVAIRALVERAGGIVVESVRVRDDLEATTQTFRELASTADVLVTLGGVSVGKHDVVRGALSAAGAELEFWKVAIKPGKPFTFGKLGRTRVLGLPGNPVSAQVTFALFGVPLLRTLHGERRVLPALETVTLEGDVKQRPGRLGIYRAVLEGRRARLLPNQSSGSTLALALADALIFVPQDASECAAGSEVDALRLSEI
jgi:molybdopterin molybdotransferase